MQKNFQFSPIGFIKTPYKEKFGIPRQSGLVMASESIIELNSPYDDPSIVKGLESFSHIWLIFVFHAPKHDKWKASVRPPRLGGNKRLGVFATRSPFRPNPIGMSAVELKKIEIKKGKILLHLAGADLLDGTPILDIKPYIKECDVIKKAQEGWLKNSLHSTLKVKYSPLAKLFLKDKTDLKKLITQIIKQDPRPRYQENTNECYAFRLKEYDVHFSVTDNIAQIEILSDRPSLK